jgi:hypothetical protein
MSTFNNLHTNLVEHEGFFFVEYNGSYFKGCRRCGGTGHYSFDGMSSDCYLCGNTPAKLGEPLDSLEAAQKWCHERAVRRAQADRKREAKRQVEVQALADKVASLPEEVRTFLLGISLEEFATEEDYYNGIKNPGYERSSFLRAMAEHVQFVSMARKPFTANMLTAVQNEIAKRATKQAEAELTPAPSGRVAVTGEIVSAKIVEGDYGTSYKALVKADEGFKVWVSIPSALMTTIWETEYSDLIEELKGRRITFTATLEPSRDDVAFAFGSRPAKGAWL